MKHGPHWYRQALALPAGTYVCEWCGDTTTRPVMTSNACPPPPPFKLMQRRST